MSILKYIEDSKSNEAGNFSRNPDPVDNYFKLENEIKKTTDDYKKRSSLV